MRVFKSILSIILAFVVVAVMLDAVEMMNEGSAVQETTEYITEGEINALPVVINNSAVSDALTSDKPRSTTTKTYYFDGSGNYTMSFELNTRLAEIRILELTEAAEKYSLEPKKITDINLSDGEKSEENGAFIGENGKISGSLSFYTNGGCLIEVSSSEACNISFTLNRTLSEIFFMRNSGITLTSGNHSVTFSWVGEWEVDAYAIRSDDGNTTYIEASYEDIVNGKTDIEFDEANYRLSYTVNNLNNGEKYLFRICAYVDGEWYYSAKRTKTPMANPQNVKAESENGEVRLSWDKVDGSGGYVIKSADGDIQYTEKVIKENSYTITGLTVGETYKFAVYAYDNGKWFASEIVAEKVR